MQKLSYGGWTHHLRSLHTCCLGLRARSTERLKSQIPSCQGEGTTPLWEGGLSRSQLWQVSSVDIPLDSFLGQHAVSSKKGYTTNNSQVLQSLKHVQVGPVDVHQPQHGCNQMAGNTLLQLSWIQFPTKRHIYDTIRSFHNINKSVTCQIWNWITDKRNIQVEWNKWMSL